MKNLLTPLPDGIAEVKSFAVDETRNNVAVYGVFRGTHTGEGGPVAPTGRERGRRLRLRDGLRRGQDPTYDQDLERRLHPSPARLVISLDDEVDQAAGHHDDLLRRRAGEERRTFSSASAAASIASASASAAHRDATAHLAVDLHRVLDGVLDQVGLVGDRERPVRQRRRRGRAAATAPRRGAAPAARPSAPAVRPPRARCHRLCSLVRWLVYSISLAAAVLLRSAA